MFKNFSIILILVFVIFNSVSKSEINIAVTVDDEIITNYDIQNEANYLKILNPKLSQLDNKKILEISKESLIREIIKKNEIEKIFDFSKENSFVNEYLKNLYTKLDFDTEEKFNEYIENSSEYSLNDVKYKLKIEITWNELIYFKYSNQVNIDKKKLSKKISQFENKTTKKYRLSEIVFKKKKDQDLKKFINQIKSSITNVGFNNTANIYSISESAKFGGDIGWINENNLSEILLKDLKKITKGQNTDVIKIGNNFIILKIEEIDESKLVIDKAEELEKMIKFETNKQLNQFSRIFFDKSKINYKIDEK